MTATKSQLEQALKNIETVLQSAQKNEIKRILTLYERAMDKVEFNHNGTRIVNPMQQGAANRLYNRAYKLYGSGDPYEFISLHREVIDELRNSQQP